MRNQQSSRWRLRPPFLCLAVTVLTPLLWMAVIGGLEYAGQDQLALGLGWLSIPIVFLAIPCGVLLSLVLAFAGRHRK